MEAGDRDRRPLVIGPFRSLSLARVPLDVLQRGPGSRSRAAGMAAASGPRRAVGDPIHRAGKIVQADRIHRGGPVTLTGGKVIQPPRAVMSEPAKKLWYRGHFSLDLGGGSNSIVRMVARRTASRQLPISSTSAAPLYLPACRQGG